MTTPISINDRLKDAGITREELATRLGVHYNTMSKWSRSIPKYAESYLALLVENRELKRRVTEFEAGVSCIRKMVGTETKL